MAVIVRLTRSRVDCPVFYLFYSLLNKCFLKKYFALYFSFFIWDHIRVHSIALWLKEKRRQVWFSIMEWNALIWREAEQFWCLASFSEPLNYAFCDAFSGKLQWKHKKGRIQNIYIPTPRTLSRSRDSLLITLLKNRHWFGVFLWTLGLSSFWVRHFKEWPCIWHANTLTWILEIESPPHTQPVLYIWNWNQCQAKYVDLSFLGCVLTLNDCILICLLVLVL